MTAGIARYTVELLRELEQRPDLSLRLMTTLPQETAAAAARQRGYPAADTMPLLAPRKLQYLLWHLVGIAGPLSRAGDEADVVHTPTFLVPPRKKTPLVVTVHDLTLLRFPRQHPWNTRILMGSGLRRAVRDADAFLAVSEYTRLDLIRLTGAAPERVFVTPEAADARFTPRPDNGALARYGLEKPYLLSVGTLEPRKNLRVLLRAFAALAEKPSAKKAADPLTLVLAGAKGWMYDEIFTLVERLGLQERVRITGYVADDDLPVLYSQAQVFIYPSMFEGFGLPVLEAMQCGTPVITTNVSSLPEVAGSAALLFTPDKVEELVGALSRILSEPGLHADMCGRSLEQARRFSWKRTADLTADVYQRVTR